MADSSVAVTPGAGANIDTRTESVNGDHRQVVVLGDPVTGANVANVTGSALNTISPDATASISIAANATSSGSVTGLNDAGTATIQLTGTFTATVQVQVTADGSTWVNITGSATILNAATGNYVGSGNLQNVGVYQVDVAGVAGVRVITTAYTSGTVTGTVRVSDTVGMVGLDAPLPAGTNLIGGVNVAQFGGSNVVTGVGASGAGIPRVTIASDSLPSVNLTQVAGNGITTGLGTAAVGSLRVAVASDSQITPTTPTASFVNASNTTNATSTKASAGTLYGVGLYNSSAETRYFKLFNKASAPTVGTDIPVIAVPVASGASINLNFAPMGQRFGTGIAWCLLGSAGGADSATTVCSTASDFKVALSYI